MKNIWIDVDFNMFSDVWYLTRKVKSNFAYQCEKSLLCRFNNYITSLFIEMIQYDWLWRGHMIIKEMFYIPKKLKPELARASMTMPDVNNQWRSNFQQQII